MAAGEQAPQTAADAAQLAALGYSQLWLNHGLLTPELLAAQYHTFTHSDDQNPEHYRYGAFRHYLNARIHLTDAELAGYLQVALAEPDKLMGGAAAQDLFTEISLTDEQFAAACEALDEFPGDWTVTVRRRQALLRQLAAGAPDEALFAECLAHGDSVVQKALLEVADAAQLAKLAASGRTKSIRNLAARKLGSPAH